MSKRLIYLDHAAATPLDKRVLAVMEPYFSGRFYNPSATYVQARQVRQAVETARSQVAYWLGARPAEIIFTAGGTEANNLALHGVMRRFPKANIVVSAIEHDSILEPARAYDCREVSVQPDGRLDLDDLVKKIDRNTVLVSVGYANNEIGTVQPLREISQRLQSIRGSRKAGSLPLYFHTDACQAGNYLDLHAARLGADLMSLNGGKLYGPKQSGALYVKVGIELEPLISGGGQERGLRSGTENVAGSIGFAAALDMAQAMRRQESDRLKLLQKQLLAALSVSGARVNGSSKFRLPNNVHATFPGQDNERLLIELEAQGILAAAGSACNASSEEPSHVLKAIGLSDADARASLRFTLGRETTAKSISAVSSAVTRLAHIT
jgi:cysteine desulfurase